MKDQGSVYPSTVWFCDTKNHVFVHLNPNLACFLIIIIRTIRAWVRTASRTNGHMHLTDFWLRSKNKDSLPFFCMGRMFVGKIFNENVHSQSGLGV